ncbi:hypothetical protein D3C78_1432290 [compost metagenome]
MYAQFDVDSAMYYMLLLESDIGSLEAVLDEYLYTLQIDITLEEYLSDKDAYLKLKEEKSVGVLPNQKLTMVSIELASLEKIQKDNASIHNQLSVQADGSIIASSQEKQDREVLPQIAVPVVESKMPLHPAEEIMKEINTLNPNLP